MNRPKVGYCFMRTTDTTSIAADGNCNVTWNTEIHDTHSWHAANSADVVVDETGYYTISCTVGLTVGTAGKRWYSRIMIDGAEVGIASGAMSTANNYINISETLYLTAGQTITINVINNDTGSLALTANATGSFLSVLKVA